MTAPLRPYKPDVEEDKHSLLSDSSSDVAFPTDEERKPHSDSVSDHPTRLGVPSYDVFRAKSPDTLSCISVEDTSLRSGRSGSQIPLPGTRRAPGKIGRIRSKLDAIWVRNKGLALVLISQVFGTLMNLTTRVLETEGGSHGKGMDPFQILFVRMGLTAILSSLYMWYKKTPDFPLGAKDVRGLLVARGLGGFFGVFGMYYSLLYLPLADATVLTFLAPSLACWACSFLIKEPFTRMEKIAALISLVGVVLIARPASFFSGHAPTPPASGTGDVALTGNGTVPGADEADHHRVVTSHQRAGAVGVAMLGVIGSAIAFTTIRWIGQRAHALISVNYFATWCFIVATVMLAALPSASFALPADLREWAYLLFLGVCGFVMQFLMAAGLQYEKSSRATNMVYTQMLFALAFDKLFFGTTPGVLSILGSSLILGSAIYVAVQKDRAQGPETHRQMDEERGLVDGMDDADDGVVPRVSAEPSRTERMPVQEVQLRALRV